MKKYFIFLIIMLSACTREYKENEFINNDCNIPIIDCIIEGDTVSLIVDSGAEYSLIDQKYYYTNEYKFRLINTIETEFHGINGTKKSKSDIVVVNTSLGYITFVEQDLTEVINSKPHYKLVGILGSEFFVKNNYIIDYKMKKIYPYEQLDSIYGKSVSRSR